MLKSVLANVSGRVQGVGFRYFTAHEANKVGVEGYAKNLDSGDVEVLLSGESEKVAKMIEWLRNGPRTATVIELRYLDVEYRKYKGFDMF